MNINTPPLGWNTWNTFGSTINEEIILKSADSMVENGYLACGYNYLVIDDCWSERTRDKDGRLVADHVKFPHGMKYVADYVHSKGLKFGMYSCAGTLTCGAYPGSFEHEHIDAATFAEWGVDFLKYDYCYHPLSIPGYVMYRRMGLALANCGRDILFSACSWGSDNTPEWVNTTGADMWRSTGDIYDTWNSVKSLAMKQFPLRKFTGKGCFNDMDMLIVGMCGTGNVSVDDDSAVLGYTEYKTHFSFWSMLSSPLMIGGDIRTMPDDFRSILQNKEVISINQDPAQNQAFEVRQDPSVPGNDVEKEVCMWARFLDNGDIAIGIFNFTDTRTGTCRVPGDVLGLPESTGKTLELHEVWTGETFVMNNGIFESEPLEAHDCRLYRAKVIDK